MKKLYLLLLIIFTGIISHAGELTLEYTDTDRKTVSIDIYCVDDGLTNHIKRSFDDFKAESSLQSSSTKFQAKAENRGLYIRLATSNGAGTLWSYNIINSSCGFSIKP